MGWQSNSYQVGLHNVGSFQVSSIPYASSSIAIVSTTVPVEVAFDRVTKFVIVKNTADALGTDAPMKFGFSVNGVKDTNYILLMNEEEYEADYKVSRIYLLAGSATQATASVSAGLTGIPATSLRDNWSGSAGVG
tara:strand:+ start:176 stop:580 length:405 start_codon:yes stop_codon:yes gene_type:complete